MHTSTPTILTYTMKKIYKDTLEIIQICFKPECLFIILTSMIEFHYSAPLMKEKEYTEEQKNYHKTHELKVIDIPDSLQNSQIKEYRIIQQSLIAYKKFIDSYALLSPNNRTDLELEHTRLYNIVGISKSITKNIKEQLTKQSDTNYIPKYYIPDIYFSEIHLIEESNNQIEVMLNEISKIEKNKKRDNRIREILSSNIVKDWFEANNNFIDSTFEYLNAVQLSIAYGLK